MHRPTSKQRQLILRIAAYVFMTASVIGLVVITVLLMLGYRLNRESNTLQQGGLVQFVSKPTGARITIGTAVLGNDTPTKITVNPGQYLAKMEKEGYNTWQKTVDVQAGSVLWLNYAQLVPTSMTTSSVSELGVVSTALDSPDGTRFAYMEKDVSGQLQVVNLRSSSFETEQVSLATELIGKNTQPLKLVAWNENNTKILATRKTTSGNEWYALDVDNPNQSVNLSTTFDITIKTALFDPSANNRVILQTDDGDLRRVNLADNSLSVVLAKRVQSFSLYDDQHIVYIYKPKLIQKLGYLTLGKTTSRDLPLGGVGARFIAGAQYFGDDFAAVATSSQVKVYQLDSLPDSDSVAPISATRVATVNLADRPTRLMFSPNERFVVTQTAKTFHTYDIELKKSTSADFAGKPTQGLRWLDQYHLYYIAANQLQVVEFDGANGYTIPGVNDSFAALSNDGKFIYSLSKTKQVYDLQRSRMILP